MAVVFVLAIVFYGINAVDNPRTAAAPATTAARTAGNAAGTKTQPAPQTTGQGASQDSQPVGKNAQ